MPRSTAARPARFAPTALAAALALSLAACRAPQADIAVEGIAGVQGRGERSDFEGQRARIEGVVTLRFAEGVFVQSLSPDADPATAEGLFVLPDADTAPLAVGQVIRAEGLVAESDDGAVLTTLADARITVTDEAALPEPVALAAAPADWEALEGMRVRIDAPLTVTGNDGLARFGEVRLAFAGRLFTPTEVALPGEPAKRVKDENRRRAILLDDARSDENPEGIAWLGKPVSADAPLRAGSTLEGVVGVVDQRWGGYRLQADAPVGDLVQAPRPAAPTVEGTLRIAGMNLLNLFNGDGQGGGFPSARGAQNHEAYVRQRAKHLAVITALDPAIIAAQELENDGFRAESAIQELADELNAAQPGARWTPVDTGPSPGTDAITVGLLYRADRVQAVGRAAMKLDGPFAYGSRPPVAQSFRQGRGPVFTVVSVHLKSKGGCEDAEGMDRDQGDGQACFNAKRLESALALSDWIKTDPTGSRSDRVALIGDFNAYAMEAPVAALRERGWQDPLAGAGSYSFVYNGEAGRLDHALLSEAFAADLTGAAKWHSNSDEALVFAYDGALGRSGETTPWRSSDHDPMLLGFDLAPAR